MVSIAAVVVTVIGGIIALGGGLIGFLLIPKIVEDRVIESVQLVDGSKAFERWSNLPMPIAFKIYFFNVTNPAEVQAGEQPIVNEIGPYVYNQYRTKINITRDDDVLSYYEYQHFEFNEEASAPHTEFDEITIVNIPLMSILATAEYTVGSSALSMISLNTAIPTLFPGATSVFQTTTPADFLFNGIYIMCNSTNIIISSVCNTIEAQTTKTMPRLADGRFRFSLLGYKNDSNDGHYSVNSGTVDISRLGDIIEWQNSSTIETWSENSTCNEIVGTDGSVFPPLATVESRFSNFNTDICRSVGLQYYGETTYAGVNGLRYVTAENVLSSPSTNSENECFCLNRTAGIRGEDGCLLDGAMELWTCVGSPVVLSLPHFYLADEVYRNGVEGMKPDESLHRIFMDLEPWSGTILRGSKRVQFNMFIRPINRISITSNLPTTLIPALWIDEGIELSDELVDVLYEDLLNPMKILSYVKWGTLAAGVLIFAIGLIWLFISRKKSEKIY